MSNKRNPLKVRNFNNQGFRIKLELIDERDNVVTRFNKPTKKAKRLIEELFRWKL